MVGACMTGSVHSGDPAWWRACMAGACMAGSLHGRRACMARRCAWLDACMVGGMHERKDGHCSKWYASYWNTFLFGLPRLGEY